MPLETRLPVEELALALECANVFTLCTDAGGHICHFNRKASAITGWKQEEVLGKSFTEVLIGEEWQQKVSQLLLSAFQGVEAVNHAIPLHTKDGRLRQLLFNLAGRTDCDGNIVGVVAVGHDVTDTRWLSESCSQEMQDSLGDPALLVEAVEDLKRVFDTTSTPFFFADKDCKVTEWNKMAARISGFAKEEAIGSSLITTFVPEDQREEFRKVYSRVMQGLDTENLQMEAQTKQGTPLQLLISMTARRNTHGEVVGVVGVGQDITELRRSASRQQYLVDDLQRLIETANAPIFGVDVDGRVNEWNRMAAHLSGFSKQETIGKLLVAEFINAEFRVEVDAVIKRACCGEETANFEFPLVTKTGKRIELLLNATTRRDADSRVTGMVGVGQDITKLRQAMVETTRVADDLRRVVDKANAPIFGIDTLGRVTEWNSKAAEISGWRKSDTLGMVLVENFIMQGYREEVGRILTRALEGLETSNCEFPLITKDGCRREILLNATTRRGADGEVTGVIGVGQDITELRMATAEQQRVADDLQRLIETANAPIFGVNVEGLVTEWNRMTAQLSGYTREETMGKSLVKEFITAQYKDQVSTVLARACMGEETANFEFALITKTGQRFEILLNATPRRDASGRVTGVVGVGQDITNLRKAMNERERIADDLRRVIDTANAPIFGIDTEGHVVEWNQMATRLSGFRQYEALRQPLVEKFITENYREEVGKAMHNALKGIDQANVEFPLFTKDGQRREILLNATARRGADGCVTGVICVGQDITELRKVTAEHQRVADDLQRLIETANAPIFGVDVEGHVTEWNRMAGQLSGFHKDETIGKLLVQEFVMLQYRHEVSAVLQRACQGEETANFEFPLMTKKGTRVEVLLNATPRRDADGSVIGVVGVGQDITNLRQAMVKSVQVADDLTRLIDTANAPIFGIDTEGRVTEWNRMAAQISQWDKVDTLGKGLVEHFTTEEFSNEVNRVLHNALMGNETTNFEFPLFTKDGRRREILLNATTRRGANGEVTGVIGVGQDITELRQATAEQRTVAEDLQRLIETANAPIFGVDVLGRVTEWNRMSGFLSGYSKTETMGKNLVEQFVTAEYRVQVAAVLARACRGEETANFEFPLVTKTGKRIEVLLNATTRRDANGHVTGVVGVGQDITNLRHSMADNARVADDLTRLIDTANAPIFGIDTNGHVTEWNQMATALSGHTKEETLGMPLVEKFISEQYREGVGRVLMEALQGVETANFEFPLFTKEGLRREILLNATTRRGADGEIIGVIGVGQDITEVRKVTAEHKRVADDLQRLIESANAPIFGVDVDGHVTEWNRMAAQVSGFSRQETMGKLLVQEFITSEYRQEVSSVLARACEGEETANFEFPLVTKTGTRVEVLLNATPRRDADGRVVGVVGVGQDITNLRSAMVKSAQVADDYTRLIDTANAPIFGIDTKGRVTEWNRMAARISQWSKDDTLGKSLVQNFITESYREEVGRVLQSALEGDETANYEFPLFTRHGHRREILLNATTRRGANGEITGVIGVGQDITELRDVTREQQRVADDLRRLIETANAPIFGVDAHGRVTDWNRMAAFLSGYSKEETLGRLLVEEFITAEYRMQVAGVLARAVQGQETANFEFPLVTKTGKRIELLLNATARRDAGGSVIGVVGVGQDITTLRSALSESARVADDLTRVIDTANAPIFGIDTAGHVTEWNQKATVLSGYSNWETLGRPLVEQFISEEYRPEVGRVLALALEGRETANFEFPLFTKDGRRREILLNATTRRGATGEITGVIGVGQDITELRKVTPEQERVAEDLRRLIDGANAPILGVDVEGHVTEWNRMSERLLGFSREETMGRELVSEFISEECREEAAAVLARAFQGEETENFEFSLVTKAGMLIKVLLNATPRWDAEGEVIGMVGVGQDITKLWRAMSASSEIADDLRRVIDTANAPIFGIDTEGKVTEWNRMAAFISQWSREETMGLCLVDNFITESYREEVGIVLQMALEGNETANYEFPLFTKDGHRREILLNATTRRGAAGNVTGVIGVGQDITELRKVTAEQQTVADDLRRLIETANAPIFGVDTWGRVTEWNRMAAFLSGYSKEETMGKFLVDDFITSEYRIQVGAVLARACQGEETANFEFPLVTKTGKRIEVLLNATTRRDALGNVTGMVGVGQDITNLRQAMVESALVADDLTRVIDTANAPIFGIDNDGKVTEWNQMATALSGWDKKDTLGKDLVEAFITEKYKERVGRVLTRALQGNETANYEFPLFTKDGRRREILLNATTRRGADGSVTGVIGVGQDITELRKVTAQQQRVADDLQRLIESANAPIFGVDVDGRVTEWNRMAAQLSGYSKSETMGKLLVEEFISRDYKKDVANVLQRANDGDETANFEFPLMTKTGQRVEVLLNATPRTDPDGLVIGVVGVGQDITNLRHAMVKTQQVADDLTRVIDTANAPIFGIDTKFSVTEWNRMAALISGWTKAETLGKSLVENFITESYREEVGAVLQRALEGNETANYEFPLFTRDGWRREILLNATTRRGADGVVTGVIGVGQDITELRKVTAQQQTVADDLQRLIETANAPIFGVDVEGRVTEWNKMAAILSGYSKQETMGKFLVNEFITVEYRSRVAQVLKRACEGEDTANFEFPLMTKMGKRVEVLLNATTRRDANGEVTGVVGVGQDITELRKAMVDSARIADDLTRVLDTANAPIFGIDMKGHVTEWNQMATLLSGWSKEDTLGHPLVDEFIAVSYRDDVGRVLKLALEGNETANYEFPLFTKNGERREILLNATTRRGPNGEVTGVIGVGQDITELRKVTAEQLRVADDLQRLIETANAPIFGVDVEGRVTEWNRMAAHVSGFSRQETMGKNLVDTFVAGEYRADVSSVLAKACIGEETANFEFPLVTKTGKRVEVLLNATPRRAADGSVIGVVGVGQDITNLRQAMVKSARVADDLTRVINTANAPIFGIDTDGRVTEWNRMAAAITGYEKEDTLGKPLQQFIRESYREEVSRVLSLALEGTETANYEFPLFTKDGRRREILLNATTRRGADSEVTGVIGVGQDITELREVIAEQQHVADDLKRLIESANAPIFGVNVDGHVTEWNRMAASLSGFSKDETMGRKLVDEFITPEYKSEVSSVLARACRGEETANFEFPLVTKSGKRVEVLLNATPRRDADGSVIGMVGVGQDITNLRKEMVRSTQVADDLTRVIDTANAPIFGINTYGLVTEWNRMAARISGWTKEEAVGKALVETFISNSYKEEVGRVLTKALKGIDTANYEFPLFSKDGFRREILLNATTRRGADGQVTGVIGVGQDITELRKVTAQQQHVAEDLQRFIETANAPIFGVDTQGRVTEWNRMAAHLSGFSKEETIGHLLAKEFITEEFKERVDGVLYRALQGEETANFEFPLVSNVGKRVDILLNATTRRDTQGEVIGVVGVGQDISALSRAFAQVQAVADDLTRLIDTANAPIFGIDTDGCVTEWNRKAAEISGWEKEETFGKLLITNFVPDGERMGVEEVLTAALENGVDSSNYEFPLCTRDGHRREILLNATARRSGTGKITGVIGVGQDITELNVQRRKSERIADDLSRLIDTANAPIFGVDKQSRVTVWNQKVASLSGYPYEAVIHKPLVQNFISEEYRNGVAFVLLRALGGETVPNFEIALFAKDGERREVLMNAMPRLGADGKVIGVIGVGHDITEIRRVTAEQKREAEDMARLIRCANAPIIGMDRMGLILQWNDKVAQMSGYIKDEVAGHPLVDLLSTDQGKQVVVNVLKKANSGQEEDLGEFDVNLKTQDGRQLVLTMSGATFRDARGNIAGMVACGQDLTKMRDTMNERTRVAEDLTRLIDTANAPIFGIDTEGRVTEWNRKTEEISGWSKEQSLGKPLVEAFITKEYREDVGRILHAALEGNDTTNFEFPLFTKDGQRRELLLNATTRCGADGEVTGVIGVGQDITELRAVMVEQQRVADDLSRFIETANAPIFGVDVEGCVTEWNKKAAEISGFSKEETMGKSLVEEFITHEHRQRVQLVLQRAAKGEETGNFEFPLVTKDFQQIEILLNATPRRDSHGKVTGMVGVGQEITLLRRSMMESALVADDLTRLIDTANAPIFGIDVKGCVTEWNRKAVAISGFAKEETMGKPLVECFISESYRDEVGRILRLALDGHESSNFEFPLFTKEGMRKNLLLNATTRRGAEGQINGVIGVGQDITELRAVMRESQLVADDLSRLIETANAPIFGLDVNGFVNEWNRKVAIISGFTRQEVLGRPFVTEFIDMEHQTRVQDVLERALGGEVVGNFELLLYSRGGEKHDILLNATPRRGADGNVKGVVGVGQDITELNRQKSEAIRRAAELRHIIDTASAPIVGIDKNGNITEWNRRVTEVTGFTKDLVEGKEFIGYILEGCRAETHRVLSDAFAGHSTPNFEVLVATKWQEPVIFLLSAAPRMSSAGNILGVICIGQDITQMKELELKKSQFAATVTHELRSPLHGIIGLSDNLLADSTEHGRLRRSLHMINNCARRLLDLVTNIMDLSTLVQSKKMKLSRDPVHMAKIVEEVLMLTTCAVDKAGHPVQKSTVQLLNQVPNDLPIIEADAHRCTQMLYNLITNALKFTERGQVKVTAYADDETEFLTVAVADTGIGIAPPKKDLIFRPFEQADQSESRRYEGLGLGLSISREVAVKHGGSLTVESEPGKGATFYISLPYKPFHSAQPSRGKVASQAEIEAPSPRWYSESSDHSDHWRANDFTPGSTARSFQRSGGFARQCSETRRPSSRCSKQDVVQQSMPLQGAEAQELRQLRFLAPSLQRQNAHFQLQITQLKGRLAQVENDLLQTAHRQAAAEEHVFECGMQIRHMDIDKRAFSRADTPTHPGSSHPGSR